MRDDEAIQDNQEIASVVALPPRFARGLASPQRHHNAECSFYEEKQNKY